MALDYEITVVAPSSRPWESDEREARKLAKVVPLPVAARWKKVRRELSPQGLKRKAREARN